MTTDPVELLKKTLPDLFNGAASEMQKAAAGGDADAKARHESLTALALAVRVVLEGEGGADLSLVLKDAHMQAVTGAVQVPVALALAVPAEALQVGLEELEGDLEAALPKLKQRLTRLRAHRIKALLGRLAGEDLRFHLVIKDTPDFDEVRVKIAVGSQQPPDKPAFTLALDYDTIEELRARKLKPQAIMGRLQITGDASRAMQLGMELMQRPRG